ncbi:MAG TPA: rod shape-determining protein, partial [Turneriella sp.]|nr:rod shape-determining protein [Turneriella sp.]
AVISLGGMVIADSIRIGGDEFDEAIIKHLRLHHNLIIGERTAEEIKLAIGNAMPEKKTETFELKGRDAGTGLPRTVVIDSAEVRKALKEPIDAIVEATKIALEKTPPELAADIVERGIVMTGGGCLLKGLDKHISKETGVPVIRAENPLNCVVEGTGKYLEELKYLKGR